jgi:hypothetical protein
MRLRYIGHIEFLGKMRNICTSLFEKPEGKSLVDLGIDGRIIIIHFS